jgi:hypothetical protein
MYGVSMIFEWGYYIVNRFIDKFFSEETLLNDKLEIVYCFLIRKASFKNDDTNGIVCCSSIKSLYSIFGHKGMSRYLDRLKEKGLIDILRISKNQYDYGSIKIIHYKESQQLNKYGVCPSESIALCHTNVQAHATVESKLTYRNNKENNNKKNSDVTAKTKQRQHDILSDDAAPACSYIEEQNNRSNRIKNTVDETEQLPTDSNFYDLDSLAIAPSKPVKIAKSKKIVPEGKSVEVVNAYKLAYKSKYGVDPIINAATRGQACKLVDAVGKEVAPMLAQFYLTHNAQWYVRNLHKFGLLLSDAEKLHTEMQKGEYMTESMARKADKQSHEQSMMNEVQRKIDSGYFNFDED